MKVAVKDKEGSEIVVAKGEVEYRLQVHESRREILLNHRKGPFRIGSSAEVARGYVDTEGKIEVSDQDTMPWIIGHRGLGQAKEGLAGKDTGNFYRENTLGSLLRCKELGVQVVEIDVQLTGACAESGLRSVIVHHDLEVGGKRIENIPLADLLQANLVADGSRGDGDEKAELDLPFPLLADVLERVDIAFNVEVKYEEPSSISVHDYCSAVMEVIAASSKHSNGSVVVSSFHRGVCEELKKYDVSVLLITEGHDLNDDLEFASAQGLYGIVSDSLALQRSSSLVAAMKAARLHVFTYGSCNNCLGRIAEQHLAGVDGVITDLVGVLVHLI